jgi:dihydroorotate dehydrogenase electron transfer subunit
MYFFAREQAKRTGKTSATLFYGARSAHDLGIRELIVRIPGMEDNLILATDDGTLGEHGNICQAIEGHIGRIGHYKTALVCGPTRMMEATTHLLNRLLQEMTVLVSLENRMPCGTGACSGCVVGRIDANGKPLLPTKVCVEGPVFNGRELIWSQVEEGATFSPELQAEGASCSM